ncbi:hypothetical protein EDF81_0161 [Enterobacter sp. BIGb0383]|uniref:hypothetical protein n=1 Tax=unclassified Enterobacter TaxID=2608935 RepID=UPI000F46DEB7|nr:MULTISPECIES: hypothetical protein [unclassified Enterobacter]ROP61689.1 hypothetical protein EDF81_0161 [Enterobacter sp. BIGb0383]ROS11850.1 hypothetical protein EC848_0161 [Enterobacter sp. BIGb0359]
MKFEDTFFSREERYSIGIEKESGRYYLSIPVTNHMIDYEEYYEISESDYNILLENPDVAVNFAKQCKKREKDDLLIVKPGELRGIAS